MAHLNQADTPESILRLWDEGRLGASEFRFRLIQTVSTATLEGFLKLLPQEILEQLRMDVEQAPATDEAWSKMRIARFWSWRGPCNEEIAAKVREEDAQAIGRYRIGVETLRQAFSQHG